MRSNVISIIKEPSSSPSASAMLSLSPPIIISQFKIIPIDDSFTSVLFILLNTLVCHSTPTGLPSYIKLPPSTVGVPSQPPNTRGPIYSKLARTNLTPSLRCSLLLFFFPFFLPGLCIIGSD
ncbi:uncharacterized protein BO96DRAFT_225350 [Aspergillus niger CBS 101883]|uniref:uncharacterized protein n=1 Tax=Aspergillus lacticoffeatus (strain CBS 101883) TaxID=1450533 RepID=UPI000D7FB6AC|nr:uncharacterized protein BO96DRAFT_225350 [Aspergillus niger CBS 101883]PYH58746.1 hypothetical protein BO96DRAFT_225350 [Aspergillus niger CBS 101883]